MTFSKLESGITESSLWSEDLHVRVVFLSFLAKKDETGFVSGSRPGLIRVCNVTAEQFDDAILKLSSPDPESKTSEYEGRRIAKCEGGYVVLNSEKYRLPEQVKKEKHAEYMRDWREKNITVNDVNSRELTEIHKRSPSVSVSVSVSKSSSVSKGEDSKEEGKKKTWRDDIDIYFDFVKAAHDLFKNDPALVEKHERLNPGVDILLTVEKSVVNFWGTEAGWKHKKKSRTKEIDMVSTLVNSISQSMNKVYKPRQFQKTDYRAQQRQNEFKEEFSPIPMLEL